MATGRHFKSETPRASQPLPVIPATRAHRASEGSSRRPSRPTGSRDPRRKMPVRPIVMAVLALAVVGVAVAGVMAWLTASGVVENTFDRGQVNVIVNEDGPAEGTPFKEGDKVKQNVDVTNEGNVPVYVRALVNIYFIDGNGNQVWDAPQQPTGTAGTGILDGDYTISWGSEVGGKWLKADDGYFYWSSPLSPGDVTSELIDKLTYIDYNLRPDDWTLVCDIAVQAIQADPTDAVVEAWSSAVTAVADDGTLTITKAGE